MRSIDPPPRGDARGQTLAPVAPQAEAIAAQGVAESMSPMPKPTTALLRDVPRIDSQRLFAGTAEVQIEHHGVTYRLKQTALGKLILTK